MPSVDYPFPDPQNDAEREANRQAVEEYENRENQAAVLLPLAEELSPLPPELLLAQVRLDLTAAGLQMAPPGTHQGGVVVYADDDAQIVVDWLPNPRPVLPSGHAGRSDRTDDEISRGSEAARSAMETALETVLTALGYRTRPPEDGFGHIVLPTAR